MNDDTEQPLANGSNGRDANGKFVRGNSGGPGNPHAKKVSQWRSAMMNAVTAADVRKIVKAMVKAAEGGDVQAARMLLDRCLGKVVTNVEVAGELGCSGAIVILPALEEETETDR